MLALNAPPGQGPVMNPFVHYRCRCCSPGSAKAEETEASSEEQQESEQDESAAASMQLVPATASTGNHPSAHAHEAARKTKAMAEFFASGNSSETQGSQPLSRLYFCDSCDEIRCTKCTQDEIVCYYCPNCLFDVPTASVKMEKHKYACLDSMQSRSCFFFYLCPNMNVRACVRNADPLLNHVQMHQKKKKKKKNRSA